jgi:hypothetical protein
VVPADRRLILRLTTRAILVGAILAATAAASPPVVPAASCHPSWSVFARSARVPPLNAVAALSDRDVWAVGGSTGGISGPVRPQVAIVHWDGRTLSTTHFPWRQAELDDVAAISADDVWSVGAIGKHALAVHWDGHRWRRVPVWPWAHAWLTSVAAIAPDDVWAAGGFRKRPLVAHWDGRAWHVNLLWGVAPNWADFRVIAAASPTAVWASGEDGLDAPTTFGFGDLEVRWDGRRWHEVDHTAHSNYDNVADATAVAPNGELWELSSDYSGNGVDTPVGDAKRQRAIERHVGA